MYLKSVEIWGFKSFADRTIFSFKDGITAIVGPNGSGKSNVADALRWVLGEQSAKELRGLKMEDVIFAGTEIRKAQSFAYVSITIDNSLKKLPIEYEEVVVGRKVYKSGESEYLINGNACRLKDVYELFLDTGIGKDGYSIIGQGQIDKILSLRPEDRRDLFDEAVGITKLKKRKLETVKNLDIERNNLIRIRDIISETKLHIEPLEKQAIKAKEYLLIHDELREYEISNFILEYDRFEEDNNKERLNLENTEKELESIELRHSNIRKEFEVFEKKIDEEKKISEELNKEISELLVEKERLVGEIRISEERINLNSRNKEIQLERRESLKIRLENLENEDKNLKKKLADILKNGEVKNSKIIELESIFSKLSVEKKKLEAELSEEIEKNANIEKENIKNTAKIEIQRSELSQLKLKKTDINQRILRERTSIDRLQKEIEATKERISSLVGEEELLIKKIDGSKEEKLLREQEISKEIKRATDIEKEIYAKDSLYKNLDNMAKNYDGYGSTVKKIMEYSRDNPEIIGVVADIIKVEKKYEIAIETALSGNIQNIVVETEGAAKTVIELLKNKKLGRATFLPLDSIKKYEISEKLLDEDGVIGIAKDLVSYEKKNEAVIYNLLGRILVVENIEKATRIARKHGYSLRIVTLAGEMLMPGGSLSGGRFKHSNNFLGRNRELEDLKQGLENLKQELTKVNKTIKELKKLESSLENEIVKKNEEISKIRIAINTEKNFEIQLEKREKELREHIDEFTLDTENIDKKIIQLDLEISKLEEKKKKFTSSILGNTKELEEKKEEIEKELAKINLELEKFKLAYNSIKTEQHFLNENIEKNLNYIVELRNEGEILAKNYEKLQGEDDDEKRHIDILNDRVEKIKNDIEKLEDSKENLTKNREELSRNYKKIFDEKDEIDRLRTGIEKEIVRLENIIKKNTEESERLVDYMLSEYNITYSKAILSEKEFENIDLKKLIQSKKKEIKELGNVNLSAIEEYNELSKRLQLLCSQEEDISKAEEELMLIIADLERLMKKQFEEKFKEIGLEFERSFSELFGGGRARIELVDTSDKLESGIVIKVEPPGKKLQNMMQLSGGEKALTAIALLFAIQALRPSPFCILDEIDAALDEANVTRFAGYLKRLTKATQFIVITHRRGTMNMADVLYGITMQEKGISTQVSVNLIDSDLD